MCLFSRLTYHGIYRVKTFTVDEYTLRRVSPLVPVLLGCDDLYVGAIYTPKHKRMLLVFLVEISCLSHLVSLSVWPVDIAVKVIFA